MVCASPVFPLRVFDRRMSCKTTERLNNASRSGKYVLSDMLARLPRGADHVNLTGPTIHVERPPLRLLDHVRPRDQWLSLISVYFFLVAFFSTNHPRSYFISFFPEERVHKRRPESWSAAAQLCIRAWWNWEACVIMTWFLSHWNLPGAFVLDAFSIFHTKH